ncbi:hypothetical protein LXA28_17830, partial [Erwinia amylovora]|uniref:hypothetical protein n=1 Tax=Erwinia amylovora TaxID=552 RepID=UPI0020BF96E3
EAEYQAENRNAPCQNCLNRAKKADFNRFLARCSPTLTLFTPDVIVTRLRRVRVRGVDVGEFIRNSLLNM